MLRTINGLHYTHTRFVFHVNNAVGKVTPAEIDHINNIKIVISQYGQNMAQNLRDIFVAKSNPVTTVSRHLGIRVIDGIPDISIFKKI